MTAPDDVRARFEAWATKRGLLIRRAAMTCGNARGPYDRSEVQSAWDAYRAAHAAHSGEVRELVEADREYDAAQQVVGKAMLCEVEAEANAALKRFAAASKRRATALAKLTHQEKP